MKLKIIVIGFYNKKNIGDNLFENAFQKLFPNFDFRFVNTLTKQDISDDIAAIFIGGGSILNGKLPIDDAAYSWILTKSIFYIGIGGETQIDNFHYKLLSSAKIIATRTENFIDKLKEINNNVISTPDLIYSLNEYKNYDKINKSILIIPNSYILPTYNSPNYQHLALSVFKSEFSQFLDEKKKQNFTIHFLPMSENNSLHDNWVSYQIISEMKYRDNNYVLYNIPNKYYDIIDLIGKYELVITQRFHGIILSDIANTKCISIHHHDKLISKNSDINIPYYGFSKKIINDAFNNCYFNNKIKTIFNINSFNELIHVVNSNL